MVSKLAWLALTGLLALTSSIALAETPDECAARLSSDLQIESFAEATAWYWQVWHECATNPEDKGLRRLAPGDYAGAKLPKTGCRVYYEGAVGLIDGLSITVYISGNFNEKARWEYDMTGVWLPVERGKAETANPADPPPRGIHQIAFRTPNGVDKFEILETWAVKDHFLSFDC